MIKKIDVVTRSFQGGKTTTTFDMEKFMLGVANPINRLFDGNTLLSKLIVVTNVEPGNKLAELIGDDGIIPTIKAFGEIFPNEIKSGKIILHACSNWGRNPGSGTALNEGLALTNTSWISCWSPEIDLNYERMSIILNYCEMNDLSVAGFLREGWQEREAQDLPQNTANLWRSEMLKKIGGFDPICNGIGETVTTEEFGEVDKAGMEDFDAQLRLMMTYGDKFKWGMVCGDNPLKWTTVFKTDAEMLNHRKKLARQSAVMRAWAKKNFPSDNPEDVLQKFKNHRYSN